MSYEIALPCGHVFDEAALFEHIWIQTGCDTNGEHGETACPSCNQVFAFAVNCAKGVQPNVCVHALHTHNLHVVAQVGDAP